jgi:hypothetical protein
VAEHRVMSCHIAVGANDMALTTATPLTDAALGVACKPLLDGTSKGIILQMLHEIHKHHGHYLLT